MKGRIKKIRSFFGTFSCMDGDLITKNLEAFGAHTKNQETGETLENITGPNNQAGSQNSLPIQTAIVRHEDRQKTIQMSSNGFFMAVPPWCWLI